MNKKKILLIVIIIIIAILIAFALLPIWCHEMGPNGIVTHCHNLFDSWHIH